MDGAVLGIVGFVAALVAFDLVALRFGHDSRVTMPQEPLGVVAPGGDPAARPRRPTRAGRLPPRPGLVIRGKVGGYRRRSAGPFVPHLCREAACALRPDLAAYGK